MLTHQHGSPVDDVRRVAHTLENHRHMAGTLGGVIGHERALADVVGDTGQQQCLEMIVIVPSTGRCLAPQTRRDLHHMPIDGVPVGGRGGRTVADAEPFRHPSTRNVHEIDALPHFHKIRSARKQTDKQLARFVIPLVVVNRAALQINQGRRVDGKTEFAGRHGHTQRQLGILGRLGTGRQHQFAFVLGHAGSHHVELRGFALATRALREHLEERESRLFVGQRMFGAGSGGIKREGDAPTDTGKQCLQIVDRVGGTLVFGPSRIGKAKHGSHFGLIGRQHQVGILAGHQMDAVAYVEQTFHSFVVNAVRAVGQP